MDRRRFLLTLAGGLAGATAARGTADLVSAGPTSVRTPAPAAAVTPDGVAGVVPESPPAGVVAALPGRPPPWR